MRVLITGGAGYLGTSLCAELAKLTHVTSVTVLDNLSRPNFNLLIGKQKLDGRFRFIEADILDSRNLRKVVNDADIVYHLAAKVTTPFADQNAHLYDQVNHWGTAELCYAIEDCSVESVIYTSSASVYGAGDDLKNIHTEPNPHSFYGISKLNGERQIERLKGKCKVRIVRCGNVYGYNRSVRFDAVVNRFMLEAHFHGKINVHGTGAQHRPFIYIETIAEHLVRLLNNSEDFIKENAVEDNFSINEIVSTLKKVYSDLEVISINHNVKMRELKVDSVHADSERLELLHKRMVDFNSQFTF